MEIKLIQRTKTWYEHRKKYINSTEIAPIMNLDKFKTKKQLIHDKLFGTTFTSNKFTEHGIKMEPIAKSFFEKKANLKFPDTIFTDDKLKIFSASLDGYNNEKNIILEIKCPFVNEDNSISKTWTKFLNNPISFNIPTNYYCQIQCQLYCTDAKLVYFLVYFNDEKNFITKVFKNEEFQKNMEKSSLIYLNELNEYKEELMKTKFLKSLSILK